ncbi:MAG: hypothetical protein ACXW31_16015 [Thermoanaerobaculia bacterium]
MSQIRHTADFYSLFMVPWEMRRDGFVLLRDRDADKLANHVLVELTNGVDLLREHLRRAIFSAKAGPFSEGCGAR